MQLFQKCVTCWPFAQNITRNGSRLSVGYLNPIKETMIYQIETSNSSLRKIVKCLVVKGLNRSKLSPVMVHIFYEFDGNGWLLVDHRLCKHHFSLIFFQAHADTATLLMKNVYTPLLEISSYKKSQSKKLYSFREAFEGILSKAEEGVFKVKVRSQGASTTATYFDAVFCYQWQNK